MTQSHTAAIELGTTWEGEFASEPYESAWAREAIFFIRLIDGEAPAGAAARVQIAPDGIHWTDEGTEIALPRTPGTDHLRTAPPLRRLAAPDRIPAGRRRAAGHRAPGPQGVTPLGRGSLPDSSTASDISCTESCGSPHDARTV